MNVHKIVIGNKYIDNSSGNSVTVNSVDKVIPHKNKVVFTNTVYLDGKELCLNDAMDDVKLVDGGSARGYGELVTDVLVTDQFILSDNMKLTPLVKKFVGLVQFLDFEGGFFGIIDIKTQEKFLPIDVSVELQHNSLVFVEGIVKPEVTLQMWGSSLSIKSLAKMDINCLSSTVDITASEGKYVFNGLSGGVFGVSVGTYILQVPSSHPIGFVSDSLSVTGGVFEGTRVVENKPTEHYSGTIYLTVSEPFTVASYNCYYHGYMGGKNNLIFSNTCNELAYTIPEISLMFPGVYGIPNTSHYSTPNTTDTKSYVPAFDAADPEYEIKLYDWLYAHSNTSTFTVHYIQFTINGQNKELVVPCLPDSIASDTNDTYSYDTRMYKSVKESPAPTLNWNKFKGALDVSTSIEGNYDKQDIFIVNQAAAKWSSIVTYAPIAMHMTVKIELLGNNILGSAGPTNFQNKQNVWYATRGNVTLNTKYWNDEKSSIKTNNKSSAYYTLLHEMGHVLGIGTLWLDNKLLSSGPWNTDNEYWNSDYTNALYIGSSAVREYQNYLFEKYGTAKSSIKGIPVEEDGGSGTAGGHIEEGDSSHKHRYFDGHKHAGLDHELMTGWSESSTVPEPLSKVTVGMIEDLGYSVDYSKADAFL